MPPLRRFHGDDLMALSTALANEPTHLDLEAISRIAVEDHADIATCEAVHIGPTFAQSKALGGADADIVCDGVLLDLKSTAQARITGRPELWQLLGYAFADTEDRYSIELAGVIALRWRR